MNAFCDYSFYSGTYLSGRAALIPQAEFSYYALMSTKEIMPYLAGGAPATLPDELKQCCCEVAELLYKSSSGGAGKGIASERVGDLSITYENSENIEKATKSGTKRSVMTWLSDTDLLYRGIV